MAPKKAVYAERGTTAHGKKLVKAAAAKVKPAKRNLTDADVAAIVTGINNTVEAPLQRAAVSFASEGGIRVEADSISIKSSRGDVQPSIPLSGMSNVSDLLDALENARDMGWDRINNLRSRIDNVLGPYTSGDSEKACAEELSSSHVSRRLYRLLESMRAQNNELLDITERVIL